MSYLHIDYLALNMTYDFVLEQYKSKLDLFG